MDERIAEINRFTAGWMGYFPLADAPRVFSDLDEWFRRRMRQIRWKEWKRVKTRRSNLLKLGINEYLLPQMGLQRQGLLADRGLSRPPTGLPNSYRDSLGLSMLKADPQPLRSAR